MKNTFSVFIASIVLGTTTAFAQTTMKEYENIKQLVAAIEEDVIKFSEKSNAAAGTRVRKGLQDVKRACQEMRDAIQDLKKTNPE